MSAALKLMTADAFLEWSLDQEDRYELVDGVPRLMAGATNEHHVIVVNLIVALGARLRVGPCRPATADTAARMEGGNIRRPDVTVDCRPPVRGATWSQAPTVFFEVLSPGTRQTDLIRKANEYQALAGLRHFVLIEPGFVHVHVWTRSADGSWPKPAERENLDDDIELPAISVNLPLAEVYANVPMA